MGRLVAILGLSNTSSKKMPYGDVNGQMTESEKNEATAIMAKYSSELSPHSVLTQSPTTQAAAPTSKFLNLIRRGHYYF